MTRIIHIGLAAVFALVTLSCTAITDFDEEPSKLMNIHEEISDDTLLVELDGDLATVTINFHNPLPMDDEDEIYDLINDEVSLNIINNENNVGAALTTKPVTTPNGPGEYMVDIADDSLSLEITFYNETIRGQTLVVGGDYRCLIEVDAPNDYFEQKSALRPVEVE